MAVTYELFYFPLDGLARVSRLLLDLSGVKWTDRYVDENWDEEKKTTPFLRVPVLTEFNEDGSKFVLAESLAICRYLAHQFGWFGSNPHETAHIDMYCESWGEIHQKYWPLTWKWNKLLPEETIEKELSDLRTNVIIPILTKHEEALAKNGTGYYVGDKISLADILAAVSLPLLNYKDAVTKETHPHLFALCDKLNASETFQAQKKREFPKRCMK
ncbi:hypothetical protein Unana1_00137 [Umbelopsis nana]